MRSTTKIPVYTAVVLALETGTAKDANKTPQFTTANDRELLHVSKGRVAALSAHRSPLQTAFFEWRERMRGQALTQEFENR